MFSNKNGGNIWMIIPRRKPYFPKNFIFSYLKFLLTGDKKTVVGLLEKKLEDNLQIKNAVVVSSGRVGLYLILKFSGLKKGTEILIPGYTFGTLAEFIKKSGYRPKPVDIDISTFQMSAPNIKKSISKNTSAILATHIFGEPCDILAIKKIAKENNLLLIEDCAESLGAILKGKPTGMFGDISLSSFDIAKPLQGIRGGIVFGNNKQIISNIKNFLDQKSNSYIPFREIFRALIGYFISTSFLWPLIIYLLSFENVRNKFINSYRSTDKKIKFSYRLSPLLAFITLKNLDGFKLRLEKRNKIFKIYFRYLHNYISFQKTLHNSNGSKYMIVAAVKNINLLKLRRFLALKGIDIAIREEIADNLLPDSNNSYSNYANKHAIALPISEYFNAKEIDYVVKNIKTFFIKN